MPFRAFGNTGVGSLRFFLHASNLHENEILSCRGLLTKNLLLANTPVVISDECKLLVICAPNMLDSGRDFQNLYEGSVLKGSFDHNFWILIALLSDALILSDDGVVEIISILFSNTDLILAFQSFHFSVDFKPVRETTFHFLPWFLLHLQVELSTSLIAANQIYDLLIFIVEIVVNQLLVVEWNFFEVFIFFELTVSRDDSLWLSKPELVSSDVRTAT